MCCADYGLKPHNPQRVNFGYLGCIDCFGSDRDCTLELFGSEPCLRLCFLFEMPRSDPLPKKGHLCGFHLYCREKKETPKAASPGWQKLTVEALLAFGDWQHRWHNSLPLLLVLQIMAFSGYTLTTPVKQQTLWSEMLGVVVPWIKNTLVWIARNHSFHFLLA